jgi:glycosyltransferase involved in cell wall biosynthesis
MQLKRTLIIINGWTTKIAGGDYHMLRVAQYWGQNDQISYLVPRLGYNYAKQELKGKTLILDSPFENEASSPLTVILMYATRVLKLVLSPPALEEYDVVVASSHFLVDVLPALYVRSKNPSSKLVGYWHGLPVRNSSLWRLALRKINDAISVTLIRKYFDLVFVSNQLVKDSLISQAVDIKRIQLANYGTDPVLADTDSKEPSFDACYVGRLVKNKGVFDLVGIWKSVTAEIPNAKLAIIGDGSEKEQLAKLIEAEHLKEKIVLFGFVEEDKKLKIMLDSKLLLLPSYADDWGIAILEGLSCGLPAIVYDFPALRSVWGDDVIYVPAGDTESFGAAVLRLLHDPQLRLELSRNGLTRSARNLWTNVAAYEADAIENA